MQTSQHDTPRLLFMAHLPSLPQTLVRLLEACNEQDTDIEEIGKIIAQDVAASMKILRLANSAFIGARSKFHSIEKAVVYLGKDTVRNLAIAIAIQETFGDSLRSSSSLNLKEFWYHSFLTALLAKEIAELSGLSNPAEYYLAGLLHDIGKYLISLNFPESYKTILEDGGTAIESMRQERALCGISHAEAGALLAQRWNLPEPLAQAVGMHHVPPTDLPDNQALIRITALANLLAIDRHDMRSLIEKTARRLQIAPEMLSVIRAEQQENVLAIAESLGVAVAPTPQEDQCSAVEKNANPLSHKVGTLTQVYGMLDNLIRAQTTNRVLQVLEESLHIYFGIEKSILLLPDKECIQLEVKGSFRNRIARTLKGNTFDISLLDASFAKMSYTPALEVIDRQSPTLSEGFEMILLNAFGENLLFGLPFTISPSQRGILVFGENDETRSALAGNEESLLFLVAHVGSRLQLESIRRGHAEALAKEHISAMQEAAQALAHEIANPLATVQNYLLLLDNRSDIKGDIKNELQIISKELERIGTISRQLNNLAAPQGPHLQELVDIGAVIASTLQLFRQSLPLDKNISLTTSEAPESLILSTNRQTLQQILVNLIGNSLDAVGNNGWVKVQCRNVATEDIEKDEIVIEVADNGPGIAQAQLDNLFRAGFTTKGPEHAGLGLAIVKRLATDLQGRIVHRMGENGETCFLLFLPAGKRYYPDHK